MGKVIPLEELSVWREEVRKSGKRLVVTNGVFDIMHRGHAEYLARAATLGDLLLVLINDDESVSELKGPTRPIQHAEDRAAMLAALGCVAAVSIFHGIRATDALRISAPDVYAKGGDYTPETLNREEFCALQACGSEIKILQLVPGCSTTNIVKRIMASESSETDGKAVKLDAKLQPIFKRRSIRSFLPREVEEHEIGMLLEAAMSAPSAKATYPAEFIVINDKDVKQKVAECLPNGGFLAKAPLGILVCGDMSRACGQELSYMLQDCSACTENLLLAASMLGLGGCWLGVHPRAERVDALRKLFKLPDEIIPVAAVALGWPAETKAARTNFQPEQVHLNSW